MISSLNSGSFSDNGRGEVLCPLSFEVRCCLCEVQKRLTGRSPCLQSFPAASASRCQFHLQEYSLRTKFALSFASKEIHTTGSVRRKLVGRSFTVSTKFSSCSVKVLMLIASYAEILTRGTHRTRFWPRVSFVDSGTDACSSDAPCVSMHQDTESTTTLLHS